MAKQEKAGGSKKRQSDGKKLSRAACRRAAAQQHLTLAQSQELRHRHNQRLIQDGELTPWQQAEADRSRRRLSTCGRCRLLFDNGTCPRCGGMANLAAAWADRHKTEPLPAA